nr:hypothetical protein [Tanacetum cinerariifolium]
MYEGLQYIDVDIADFKTRFREAVLDLDTARALQFLLGRVRRRMSWREFILALVLHSAEEMQTVGLVYIRPIAQDEWGFERKQGAMISQGEFVARLAKNFGLLTEDRIQGLTVIVRDLPVINMAELVRLQICVELDYTWAWVPAGLARKEGDAGGVTEEALVSPRGGDEDEEMPQAVLQSPRTRDERIARLEVEVHSMREALQGQRKGMCSLHEIFRVIDRVPETTRQRTDSASISMASQQPDP